MKPTMIWLDVAGKHKPALFVRNAKRGRAWVVYSTKYGVNGFLVTRDRVESARLIADSDPLEAIKRYSKAGDGLTVKARDLLTEALTLL